MNSQSFDLTPPKVTSISVVNNTVTLTFTEPVIGSLRSLGDFSVFISGISRAISSISFDTLNNNLTLTLTGTAPTSTQSVSVAYNTPAFPVTDLSGNALNPFSVRSADTFRSNSNIGTLSIPLASGYINAYLDGTDAINAYGNTSNNNLFGNDSNNKLFGMSGNDVLIGKQGADTLTGGVGVDILTGGSGSDTFVYDVRPSSLTSSLTDNITDFSASEGDKIQFISKSYGMGYTVTLTTISSTIQLASSQTSGSSFIYDSSTGMLYWDANGKLSGLGSGGVVASLSSRVDGSFPSFSSSNISLV